MKTILIVLISLVVFCGCTQAGIVDTTPPPPEVVEPPYEPPLPADPPVEPPEEELPYAFVLSPGFDRGEGIEVPLFYSNQNIAFDFGELLLEEYPYGEWSVDELEEKYGKADTIRGSIGTEKYILVSLTWTDLYVLLQNPRGSAISFDVDSSSMQEFYSLSDQDRTIKISVKEVHLYKDSLPLPRGLKIGQSTLEQVKSAYPVDGNELKYNTHTILYSYVDFDEIAAKEEIKRADIGYIKYYFGDEILSAVEVGWEAA